MMNTLIFFRGMIRIKINGEQMERFLNLCLTKNIYLWDISCVDKTLYAYMDLKNFRNLKSIAKKTKCRVVVIERKGLPFLWNKCEKHKGYMFGFLIAVLLLSMSLLFIWKIKISGNYEITQEMLSDLLTKEGIHIGMFSCNLKTEELEKAIRNKFDQFIWVNVKKKGWTLSIEVKENASKEMCLSQEDTGDLISPYDGRIHTIVTRKGIPKVNKGMDVQKGQLLVEGTVPITEDGGNLKELVYVRADADIELEHAITWEYVLQKNSYLKFGEKQIEFPIINKYKSADKLSYTKDIIRFDQNDLLFGYGFIYYREFYYTEHIYSFEEAERIFNEKITLFLETLQEKGVQILQKDVKIETYDDYWEMQLNLTVIEHIGEEVYKTYNMSDSVCLEETESIR